MNLIRLLLSFLIIINMLPLTYLSFSYISNISFDYSQIEDEIALMQLREILLIGYDFQIHGDSLTFIYQNKDFSLRQVNNRLLLQPGTQIFLDNVDDISFYSSNGIIYLDYEKNKRHFTTAITKEAGFYLDGFSDCLIDNSSDNRGQE